METIALFGGSFDPPHIGHKAIVKSLCNLKDIDKVIVMPTFFNGRIDLSEAEAIGRSYRRL